MESATKHVASLATLSAETVVEQLVEQNPAAAFAAMGRGAQKAPLSDDAIVSILTDGALGHVYRVRAGDLPSPLRKFVEELWVSTDLFGQIWPLYEDIGYHVMEALHGSFDYKLSKVFASIMGVEPKTIKLDKEMDDSGDSDDSDDFEEVEDVMIPNSEISIGAFACDIIRLKAMQEVYGQPWMLDEKTDSASLAGWATEFDAKDEWLLDAFVTTNRRRKRQKKDRIAEAAERLQTWSTNAYSEISKFSDLELLTDTMYSLPNAYNESYPGDMPENLRGPVQIGLRVADIYEEESEARMIADSWVEYGIVSDE